MGRTVRLVRGEAQKTIARLMDGLSGRYSGWEIWQDFIIMSATSIANCFNGPYREEREKMYMDRAQKYSQKELEVFAEMLGVAVADMERNSDQDFFGDLFMSLGLGDEWKGQFFTPYNVCRMMAAMNIGDGLKAEIESKGWIGVNDPACGAGALLVAFANECRHNDINFQQSVLFTAQDLDFLAGMMCYIQLSLMGCPGYVVIGDTLRNPATCVDRRGLIPVDGPNVWYTPMYYMDVWQYRCLWAQIDLMTQRIADTPDAAPEKGGAPGVTIVTDRKPETPPEPGLHESEDGQLTLF